MPAKFDPQKHHRRSIRLKGYDYSQVGAYFVTMVTTPTGLAATSPKFDEPQSNLGEAGGGRR